MIHLINFIMKHKIMQYEKMYKNMQKYIKVYKNKKIVIYTRQKQKVA